jgi:Zn-dependent peptidase ImmA (M78 family)/DNA-binding XRE family transcriptional regulator
MPAEPKPTYQPQRLTIARERRGLSKTALGDLAGLTPRRISSFERDGDDAPPPTTLQQLAETLQFPVEYFYRPVIAEPAADAVSFRAQSRMSARSRRGAIASAQIAFELASYLDELLHLPPPDLPDLRDVGPTEAAAALRSLWGLGVEPAPNLIHLLESRGARVFSIVDEYAGLDAFSMWSDGTPFVFLTRHKTPERGRWDAAHELGHLVLHLEARPGAGRDMEAEADEFAREFLMPARAVDARATLPASLETVRYDKVWWGVSAMAYLRQLKELGHLTDWKYRALIIDATEAGLRKDEGDIDRETSSLLPRALELLATQGIGVRDIARNLQVSPDELTGLTFQTMVTTAGGGRTTPPRRGHLQLVHDSTAQPA